MNYISVTQYLGKLTFKDLTPEQQGNLGSLVPKVNELIDLYGKPLIMTSGFRSKKDQIRIYKAKGITDESKIPMQSKHLYAAAIDLFDDSGKLKKFILDNDILNKLDLWSEDFNSTKNWVHIQCLPYGSYKSGKSRLFVP